ncbi:CHAP domain-containing protein [Erysipelothrix urinaevulpis]|uniref:CHAP domain-containing protein n=1 Tax=Erysipelothrix urinaevulpis TaxID=2683717 RepID=UPI001356A34F|nr:CHAP domain-containing protein [Erysipelothrix urinaevulpis]
MITKLIRKSGSDLKHNKNYNQWNGEFNPFFPEFAPKSVGGTMSGVPFKDSKGNCTWYVSGRLSEVFGKMPARPQYRPDAKYWGTNGEPLSKGPEVGGVVVFGDNSYGHVAFIEKIVGSDVYVSESSYSTRGNDFLFRYGRTIDQIKKEWNMTVLRYLAPFEKVKLVDDLDKEIPEDGEITVTVKEGLRVRKHPSLSAEQIGLLQKGAKRVYTHYVDEEGIRWVKLKEGGYSARRTLDNKQTYADARFINKPAAKPKTDVGKSWKNNRNPLPLYPYSTGSTNYGPSKNIRTYKILKEEYGRIQIKHEYFDSPGNLVWVNKDDGKLQ